MSSAACGSERGCAQCQVRGASLSAGCTAASLRRRGTGHTAGRALPGVPDAMGPRRPPSRLMPVGASGRRLTAARRTTWCHARRNSKRDSGFAEPPDAAATGGQSQRHRLVTAAQKAGLHGRRGRGSTWRGGDSGPRAPTSRLRRSTAGKAAIALGRGSSSRGGSGVQAVGADPQKRKRSVVRTCA